MVVDMCNGLGTGTGVYLALLYCHAVIDCWFHEEKEYGLCSQA